MKLRCIDFFAGIGAWELAIELVNHYSEFQFKTIKFIEIDPFAQKVLRSHYPNIPIHSDIKNYQPTLGETDVYLISFPCTGTSIAGKRTGLNHPESNLWYESLRCIILGKPKFVVIENPEGFINRGLRAAIAGLNLAGYQTEIELITAAELGAPHKRSRIFIIAYPNDAAIESRKGWCCWNQQIRTHIARAKSFEYKQETKPQVLSLANGVPDYLSGLSYNGWWKDNPPLTDAGINRLEITPSERRKMINLIGRSIVPLQAAIALMRLKFLVSLTI